MSLQNCWEIKKCGRQSGGVKEKELGICVAAKEGLGHSCWAIAGTLCGGVVQGTTAQKEKSCMTCQVYKDYNRMTGVNGKDIGSQFPEEQTRYSKLMKDRMTK